VLERAALRRHFVGERLEDLAPGFRRTRPYGTSGVLWEPWDPLS
jgi:hypothetical protein